MRRFLFFTKTSWDEPPRLRHQLARLLSDGGHQVVFFQRPTYRWFKERAPRSPEGAIQFLRHRELLHHKLRLSGILHSANAALVTHEVERIARSLDVNKEDIVVNFNYDYSFLRGLFPDNRLITIINDDFWSEAILGYERPLRAVLEQTCRMSDVVLTVSHPLMRQLREYCAPQLFLPWATSDYQKPECSASRRTLLFWGFINRKIDFPFVDACADRLGREAPEMKLLFVGPVEIDRQHLRSLEARRNVEIRPAEPLENLPLNGVLAGFIPYRRNIPAIDAIYLPNKALPLLVRGIPLIIHGMPNFLDAPFVFRMNGPDDVAIVEDVRSRFCSLQPDIEAFTAANTQRARLDQFLQLVA